MNPPAPISSAPAPIMMSTYRRLSHVRETLAALARNPLASQSTIYITSDGPMPGHRDEVFAVRRHLETLEGFGRVELRFFEKNDRMQIWNQRREVSQTHQRYIYLEEDCVPAPGFLSFINEGLDRHADDERIFSIAGYTPPIPAIRRPSLELFEVPSYNAWGFGTWERCDRLVPHTLSAADYHAILHSRELRKKIHASVGVQIYGMLRSIAEKRLFAYDIMARLVILQRNMVSLFPSESFIINTGFDGTGEHCAQANRFDTTLSLHAGGGWDRLPRQHSRAIDREFARFYGDTFRKRWRFMMKRWRGKMDVRPAAEQPGAVAPEASGRDTPAQNATVAR